MIQHPPPSTPPNHWEENITWIWHTAHSALENCPMLVLFLCHRKLRPVVYHTLTHDQLTISQTLDATTLLQPAYFMSPHSYSLCWCGLMLEVVRTAQSVTMKCNKQSKQPLKCIGLFILNISLIRQAIALKLSANTSCRGINNTSYCHFSRAGIELIPKQYFSNLLLWKMLTCFHTKPFLLLTKDTKALQC